LYAQYTKEVDRNKCDNHREITFLSCIYKVVSSIMGNRLREYAEKIIGDYQNGFRTNRGTNDNIHIFRQVKEKAYEYSIIYIRVYTVHRF